MKLKESVDIDILKKYGFQLVEHNHETGFKRYHKHYGLLLATVCNNQMEKAIHLTLNANPDETVGGKRIVASIHQFNHDVCMLASMQLLELGEMSYANAISTATAEVNDWDAQIRANNPFRFMVD